MLAFEHVCANVLGVTVWAPAPARQHRATWTTSDSAAQRVCHCWPHAGGLLTLADLQRDSIGPETSVITNQSKENYKENRVVKPVSATLSTLMCKKCIPRATLLQHCTWADTLSLMTQLSCSITYLTLLQKGICFLGRWLWLSLFFLQVSDCS